jgi:lipopolysaccharide transport system ATP-binding protein
MEKPIISVKNLGKRYSLGLGGGERYRALRDVMANSVKNLFKKNNKKEYPQEIWALKDVTFDIRAGDKVGIIGRNGAGKSTLLKILSEITEPTEGEAHIHGRVASLLEVGTGFHPELTGKENIFMNGAILGMRRAEIKKKFDEIVDFAEIEKFLDTPVKRYSSGMYVRLAFAVAAHLEPEILLIDEVLAVGDAQFQKKCLGKMENISKGGRTILFVSHNMGAIEQLCSSAMLLKNGKISSRSDNVLSVIKDYVFMDDSSDAPCYWENPETGEFDNDYFKPLKFFFSDEEGQEIRQMPIRNDRDLWINIVGEVRKLDPALYFGIGVFTETETFLFGSMFFDGPKDVWPVIKLGYNALKCKLPKHTLNEGLYKVEIHGGLLHKEFYFYPGMNNPKIFFEIKGGLSESPLWLGKRLGLFAPIFVWTN